MHLRKLQGCRVEYTHDLSACTERLVMGSIGAVASGRNEGERLEACLKALVDDVDHMVYVDSGSTDGSRDLARSLGVEVV